MIRVQTIDNEISSSNSALGLKVRSDLFRPNRSALNQNNEPTEILVWCRDNNKKMQFQVINFQLSTRKHA